MILSSRVFLKRKTWHIAIYYKNKDGERKQKNINTKLPERGNKKNALELMKIEVVKFEKELLENKQKIKKKRFTAEEKLKNVSFSDYLDVFFEEKKKEISFSTQNGYLGTIKQLKRFFKKKKLKEISTDDINSFYTHLRNRGVKETTIKHHNEVIKPTFRMAFKNKIIKENPCDFLSPIKRTKYKAKYYTKNEISLLIEKVKGYRMELPVKIACYYGFRRSEILGLKWDAIDFVNKTISINHQVITIKNKTVKSDTLKTASSYRTLPLIPEIEKDLLEKQKQQKKDIRFFGKQYKMENKDYIITDEMGRLLRGDNLTTRFRQFLKKNNLKLIRFHDLRHSCASLLLANGVSMKQIQEWLGHSNFATTADIYSHLDYSTKIQSANTIANILSDNKETQQDKDEQALLELEKEMEKLKQKIAKRKKEQPEM